MREIKFRCWDGQKMYSLEKGNNLTLSFFSEGIQWGLYDSATEQRYVCDVKGAIHSNTGTLMQFTGLKDKNGKEIYEGDILRLSDGGDVSHHRIYWDEKAARWMDTRLEDGDSLTCYDDFTFVTECKIIGNVHENPNLLL